VDLSVIDLGPFRPFVEHRRPPHAAAKVAYASSRALRIVGTEIEELEARYKLTVPQVDDGDVHDVLRVMKL
jgi:hypothetical protein